MYGSTTGSLPSASTPLSGRNGRSGGIAKVRFIFTFRQFVQQIRFPGNQCFFLFSAPSLHLFFSVKSFINTFKLFVINQFYGHVLFSEISTFTVLVFRQSSFKVIC